MNNQVNMMSGSPMPAQKQEFKLEIPQKDKSLFIAFLACIAIVAVGCFLPFVTQKSSNFSMNYISYDGNIKDGVYILVMCAVGVFSLFKGKHIVTMILQGISIVIFAIDTFDMLDIMKELNKYASILGDSYKANFGMGFYLVLIGLAGSLITVFLLWKKNKGNVAVQTPIAAVSTMPQPTIPQQPAQPQPVVQNNCPYCGSPKTPGSSFCGNCGAKVE